MHITSNYDLNWVVHFPMNNAFIFVFYQKYVYFGLVHKTFIWSIGIEHYFTFMWYKNAAIFSNLRPFVQNWSKHIFYYYCRFLIDVISWISNMAELWVNYLFTISLKNDLSYVKMPLRGLLQITSQCLLMQNFYRVSQWKLVSDDPEL